MTNNPRFPPKPLSARAASRAEKKPRAVAIVVFPDFQILDATGPLAAFEIAARYAAHRGRTPYKLTIASTSAGPIASSSGVAIHAEKLPAASKLDTLIIAGGDGVRATMFDEKLIAYVRRASGVARRIASVCSGSFVLAEAGLLEGKRATTHWSRARQLQQRFPGVSVEPDSIWVRDGKFWTSAGITAGIDLALAMITADHGPDLARDVARQLVVHAQRPGGQTQHSRLLDLAPAGGKIAALHAWMGERLNEDLCVERLAEHMGMSPRNFARAHVAETGVTPAKAVERMRVEAARAALEAGGASIPEIAEASGFGDEERMRRAFIRLFGAPPSAMRRARARAERNRL